jgi:hypothetical protein
MFDIDEAVYGAADDWFMLAADNVAHHGDSDDVAFDRWLATLPEGGLDEALNALLDGAMSAAPDRGARRSASPWRR